MRFPRLFAITLSLFVLTGCHSAFVDVTVSNRTSKVIPLIEVDYPSASFGTENLAPGKDYHYRFKVLGTGPVKVVYTDSSQQEKQDIGPILQEGNEGQLTIVFAYDGLHWNSGVSSKR